MNMPLTQMVFILGILGSLEFHCMSAIYHQNFSVCKKPSTLSCNTSEKFKCASGKIKISGLSYGENVGCVNNDSCKLETCCDRNNMAFRHSVTKDMIVYKNCSFKQECNINLADENLSPSGFIGYMRSDINYTCVEDSNIVKFCDTCVQTSDQLELIFDGSESQRFNTSPGRCKCVVSTIHPNGTFRAFITDFRPRKPSSSSSNCSSVVLNIFGLLIGDCENQSFQRSGPFIIDPLLPKTVKMDKLFFTGENDIPSLVWITVIAMNSSFVTVNCSAIETDHDYSSFTTEKSAKPIEIQTLPTIITTKDGQTTEKSAKPIEIQTLPAIITIHDGQTTALLKPTIIKEWGTSTDGDPKAANTSGDAGNVNNTTTAILLHVVLPIAGGLILIVLVSVTVLCTRRCRNKKQMLRTKFSRSNSLGNNDPPFKLDNADGVHSYEEMRELQNRELNIFPDIVTAKARVQGYDHITVEKIPPRRVPNYDLMRENVDISLFDSTYSHVPSDAFSSKCFQPDGYSQISFGKTGTGEKVSVRVDRNEQSTEIDGYSHIELESKPSVSIINPIGKSEPTISDNYSHTIIQSVNDTQVNHNSCRPGETVVDGDSYSRLDFNAKQSRDDNGLDIAIRIENSENYNYAKVNLEHKHRKPGDNMEVLQIGEVDGLDRTDGMEKGRENYDKRTLRDNIDVMQISKVKRFGQNRWNGEEK